MKAQTQTRALKMGIEFILRPRLHVPCNKVKRYMRELEFLQQHMTHGLECLITIYADHGQIQRCDKRPRQMPHTAADIHGAFNPQRLFLPF